MELPDSNRDNGALRNGRFCDGYLSSKQLWFGLSFQAVLMYLIKFTALIPSLAFEAFLALLTCLSRLPVSFVAS